MDAAVKIRWWWGGGGTDIKMLLKPDKEQTETEGHVKKMVPRAQPLKQLKAAFSTVILHMQGY